MERLGRLFLALALVGFGLENVAFGHDVVARARTWPADPAQQHRILVHVLIARIGPVEWQGVFEALGISGGFLLPDAEPS